VARSHRTFDDGIRARTLIARLRAVLLPCGKPSDFAAGRVALFDFTQPLDSAADLRCASQELSEVSRADCIPVASASTGSPAKDSFVITCTPEGVSLKIHSWTPVMPPAVPPHSTRARSATA
jgi:hypothetical protein